MLTTPTYRIRKLDSITFDDLLREQDPFGAQSPRFDLRQVKFVTPAAMVQLAAACHFLDRQERRATINLSGTTVPSYFLRSNFVNIVRPVAHFNPPFRRGALDAFDHLHGSNQVLIEVTKIETGQALQGLLSRIVDVLIRNLAYPEAAAFDAVIAVSEVAQNTFDHNDETCGFLAMQVYGQGQHRFLEIGVADFGQGLAATLRRNPLHAGVQTDLEMIERAVQNRTSQHHDDQTRGTRMYHLLSIAHQHAGSLQIRSGGANLRYRGDRRQGWGRDVPHMPGVHIALTLPAVFPTP